MKRKKTVELDSRAAQQAALERFLPLVPEEELPLLLEELKQPLAPSLRVNPLKSQPEDLQKWAQRYGWQVERVPFCAEGWRVPSAQVGISQTIEHKLGQYYIQDAASMLPVELFDWEGLSDPLVLDLAASPGGKTTHLLAKTGDRGLVLANDASAERITALRLVLQTWGGLHAAVTNFHGEKFGRWFPNTFDRVLLDAPCSMQGLRSSEAHPLRPLSSKERSALAQRQLNLLESALRALRPGGQVVYSTCTLEPEEDEGVLDGLLKRFPGQVQIDPLDARLPLPAPGLAEAEGRIYAGAVQQAARLWPHRYHTAGFFAARLTKLQPTLEAALPYPARALAQANWFPLNRREQAGLQAFLLDSYGLDLSGHLEEQDCELWRYRANLFIFPRLFIERFGDLPVQGLGLLFGIESAEGFDLAHEWAARFGPQLPVGRANLPEEHLLAWLHGEDVPMATSHGLRERRVALAFDASGRYMGLGRPQAGLLKNLLPKRLV